MTTSVRYTRPWLYPLQEAAIFCKERYGIVEASTKSGKTKGCVAWLIEQALKAKARGWDYCWLAPTYRQAAIGFEDAKKGLTRGSYTTNETDMTLTLVNGSQLWFVSGENPDNLYGPQYYAVVVDEATRLREAAWVAIRTTLTATEGPVRIIGNVKGRKNWAYRLARKAEAGEPNWHYAKITAHDAVQAGVLSAEEVEDARKTLPEAVFNELYLAQPSDDEGNPFGMKAIRECIQPLSAHPAVAFGWDLAKSVDWTVGIGLDRDGRAAEFRRFQAPWPETVDRIFGATGKALALVDSTGVGDPILDFLQKRSAGYEGYKYNARSKQQLMERLALAIQQHKVGYPDGPIVLELESFEYTYTRTGVLYTAPEGNYDDCVNALALAWSKFTANPPYQIYAKLPRLERPG